MHTVPRGIDLLLKKAAVDWAFRERLLELRGKAAEEIGLSLSPMEMMLLRAAPRAQLEATINATRVPNDAVPALRGKVAAAMLGALGLAALVSCGDDSAPSRGIQPDRPPGTAKSQPADTTTAPLAPRAISMGIQPDRPPATTTSQPASGVAPTAPAPLPPGVSEGMRPDRPRAAPPKTTSGTPGIMVVAEIADPRDRDMLAQLTSFGVRPGGAYDEPPRRTNPTPPPPQNSAGNRPDIPVGPPTTAPKPVGAAQQLTGETKWGDYYVTLAEGRKIRCNYEEDGDNYTLVFEIGKKTVAKADVVKIEKIEPATQPATAPATQAVSPQSTPGSYTGNVVISAGSLRMDTVTTKPASQPSTTPKPP